jgi:3D (Asp-Asp-Asp) domain-containing protein
MKWRDALELVREDLGPRRPPPTHKDDVAYRARWSLTWAALAALALLLAWLIGTLAHHAARNPPTTTSTTQAAAAVAEVEERIVLHPSRGDARSAIVDPPPTSPASSSSTTPPPATSTTVAIPVAKPEAPHVASYGYGPSSSSLGRFRVTCYGPPQFPAGQHTATGRPVGPGSLAVDPRVIPLGTRVELELPAGPVDAVADDTGGAVRGHHVDLWRASCSGWANPTVEIQKKNV